MVKHARLAFAPLVLLAACVDEPIFQNEAGETMDVTTTSTDDDVGPDDLDESDDLVETDTSDDGETDTSDAETGETGETETETGGPDPFCGDGVVDPGEHCDDANAIDDDACDNDCQHTSVQVSQLVSGRQHTCALVEPDDVYCWGDNQYGQLGYGHTELLGDAPGEYPGTFGPVDVGGPATALSAGDFYTCALLESGEVVCWGQNGFGKLGYGDLAHVGNDETPAQVGPVDVGAPVKAIYAGSRTCAVTVDDDVLCWGSSYLGASSSQRIGDDEHPSSAPFTDVGGAVVSLASGISHTCAVLASGEVKCWGADGARIGATYGQTIGDDETPASAPAVELPASALEVRAGKEHTCARLVDGQVSCWGDAYYGQLGYGSVDSIGDDETPASAGPVSIAAPVSQIAAGFQSSCAITEGQKLWCWGRNTSGQLGYGHDDPGIGSDLLPSQAGPVPLGPVTLVAPSKNYTCALIDGDVFCWGLNTYSYPGADTILLTPPGPVGLFDDGSGDNPPAPAPVFDGVVDGGLEIKLFGGDQPTGLLAVGEHIRVTGTNWQAFECEDCSNSFVVRSADDDALLVANLNDEFHPTLGLLNIIDVSIEGWTAPLGFAALDEDVCPPLVSGDCQGPGSRLTLEVTHLDDPPAKVLDDTPGLVGGSYRVETNDLEDWSGADCNDNSYLSVSVVRLDCAPNCGPTTVHAQCVAPTPEKNYAHFWSSNKQPEVGYDVLCEILTISEPEPDELLYEFDCAHAP